MTLKMAHIKKINKKHPQDLWTESFQRPGAYNTAHSLFTAMGQQGEHWTRALAVCFKSWLCHFRCDLWHLPYLSLFPHL